MSAAAPQLLLASTSPYRRALLERIDVPFDVDAPSFDERTLDGELEHLGETELATRLALGKGRSLVPRWPHHWILAADQLGVLPGDPPRILHKAGTEDAAIDQLVAMAGTTHTLTTAVVLLPPGGGEPHIAVDRQRLTMRPFERAEAEDYVRRFRPLDSAGSYRIEDAGIRLFDRIEGEDATGIIGLPLLAVCRLLRRASLLPP